MPTVYFCMRKVINCCVKSELHPHAGVVEQRGETCAHTAAAAAAASATAAAAAAAAAASHRVQAGAEKANQQP